MARPNQPALPTDSGGDEDAQPWIDGTHALLGAVDTDLDTAETTLSGHVGDTSNPHQVTATQANADPAGTASQAVSDHEGAADPHPQYLSEQTYLPFDAGNDHTVARPSVPATSTVAWFNVGEEPTNLGAFDVWEDV